MLHPVSSEDAGDAFVDQGDRFWIGYRRTRLPNSGFAFSPLLEAKLPRLAMEEFAVEAPPTILIAHFHCKASSTPTSTSICNGFLT